MPRPGQIAIVAFPTTELEVSKRRPVLLLAKSPGPYSDWLICMLSTRLHQAIPDVDEIIDEEATDFEVSGLKVASVVRTTRLAVVTGTLLKGAVGEVSPERLQRIKESIVRWLQAS